MREIARLRETRVAQAKRARFFDHYTHTHREPHTLVHRARARTCREPRVAARVCARHSSQWGAPAEMASPLAAASSPRRLHFSLTTPPTSRSPLSALGSTGSSSSARRRRRRLQPHRRRLDGSGSERSTEDDEQSPTTHAAAAAAAEPASLPPALQLNLRTLALLAGLRASSRGGGAAAGFASGFVYAICMPCLEVTVWRQPAPWLPERYALIKVGSASASTGGAAALLPPVHGRTNGDWFQLMRRLFDYVGDWAHFGGATLDVPYSRARNQAAFANAVNISQSGIKKRGARRRSSVLAIDSFEHVIARLQDAPPMPEAGALKRNPVAADDCDAAHGDDLETTEEQSECVGGGASARTARSLSPPQFARCSAPLCPST